MRMKVNVQTPNFAADNKLIVFIEKRLSKLEQFYDRIIFADVFLKVQKTSEKQNKMVEILLSIPGGDLIVKKEARTFEQGTDDCVHSLERQLKKRKEKLRAFF
jgi:putative sigma-54 modulation protein